MTHAVRFNTLSYASKLEDAGIPHDQAKIQTEMFSEVFEEISTIKKDVAELKTDMDARFVAVNLKFTELKGDMDVKFAKVDTRFSELKFEIIKWVIGISVAQGALIVSLLKLLH